MNTFKLKANNHEDVYQLLDKLGKSLTALNMKTVNENGELELEFTTPLSFTGVSIAVMNIDPSDLMASSLIIINK